MSFDQLGLSAPILSAVAKQGYSEPSPIQAQSIPAILEGRDVMAAAQTGTGKTAGFTLPLLERLKDGQSARSNQARALVLTPTRELAAQVGDSVATYGSELPLRSTVVYGGVKINPQMQKLRKGADILVATPGRLLDLYNQNAVAFDQLEVLVLDEADRMLDMGFIHDIKRILKLLPKKRQNLLFSATFSDDIRSLAKGLVYNPVEISVTPANSTANTVEQWIYPVDKNQKSKLLSKLISDNDWQQVLVFSRTKHGANRLCKQLTARGISSAAIHGNKSQGARTKALADFKSGRIRALVATDIAARGLDIEQLPQVVNFDLPNVAEDYVHRIGRTGRAGATGQAISLVCSDEIKLLNDIENLIKKLLPRKTQEGFEPSNELPETRLSNKPVKAKKPKKPKAAKPDASDQSKPAKKKPQSHSTPGDKKNEGKKSSASKRPAARKQSGSKNGESKNSPWAKSKRPANKSRNSNNGNKSRNANTGNRNTQARKQPS
ncbi:DEAD/DEAH box helicase [Pseudoteredinibacter isoporae]|uniref:ATP-dependent RNA helicase RhlE n=1 Tax=Pseudoteredinibacter isoporae TaxID=570281 RepID=A0A7X0JSX5_9GAMM|nr:DEAD/DEAH box helicase [Pseudoteredinibacter isoporae]MBB6521664.1 ATP-dependent RNA helicase RhlE [Pseudoteredinibacter isoporae]NHO87213.1 DEAD/DEAH box helicase [Pseudoteredinibacter isoporae]NIB23155.1 DEAD/DEAH box helicase [Pseudoteredinibacter isoporae]